jgi:hypothetical protein
MMNCKEIGRKRLWRNRGTILALHAGTEENPAICLPGIPAENRSKYLPNWSLERYRCANLLSEMLFSLVMRYVGICM